MRPRLLVSTLGLTACVASASAQGPLSSVESRRDGLVSFAYSAREDVCGHGTTFLRIGGSGLFDGSGVTYMRSSGDVYSLGCERGPVRVLVTRAEGTTTRFQVAIGEGPLPPDVQDLGRVPARTAGEYLLSMARRLEGRTAREALQAAVMADSTSAAAGLLAIARDRSLSRSLRESATGWMAREMGAASAGERREMAGALAALARDENEPLSVRRRALTTLGGARSDGVETLLALAETQDPLLGKAVVDALETTGDPRARTWFRTVARDTDAPEAIRTEALKAVGNHDAVPSDYQLLRDTWPTVSSRAQRTAILSALGQAGGRDNVAFLLSVARDGDANREDRSRAVRDAVQAGAGAAELVALYDTGPDRDLKQALIGEFIRIGDRASLDKVREIARSEPDPQVRRMAINRLARVGDEESVAVLKELLEP